jgi:hypothetical protein
LGSIYFVHYILLQLQPGILMFHIIERAWLAGNIVMSDDILFLKIKFLAEGS